ncbi:hypothetical protein D3C78_713000 [compost metagenome]
MRGGRAVFLFPRLAEPLFRLCHVLLADIVPAEQQGVARKLVGFGKPLKPHHIGGGNGNALFFALFHFFPGLRHELAGEIVLHRFEFQLAVCARFFLGQQIVHHFRWQKRRCLLHRGEPVACNSAIVENVEIGVARPSHPVGIGEGVGHPPQNIDFAAGQQAGIVGRRIHHRRILLEIGGIDEPLARFGQGEHARQIVGRLPAGFPLLAVGNRLSHLGITAVGIELPHGIEPRIAVFGNGERIGRRRPVGIKRAKTRDFSLKALGIASRRKIA